MQQLKDFVYALRQLGEIEITNVDKVVGNVIYTGCGDSLASSYLAQSRGSRAMSAGDIEWMESIPPNTDTLVGISLSGTSGAPIRALRRARDAGITTLAVTSDEETPLGQAANFVQALPRLDVKEELPVAGHVVLSLGVAATLGIDVNGIAQELADRLETHGQQIIDEFLAQIPKNIPGAVSVLSLPDLRSGANFWTLKFMEGCGLPARDVPVEESGHVDYFIGPQEHLIVSLLGRAGKGRFDRLCQALEANGMTVISLDFGSVVPQNDNRSDLLRELFAAVVGTYAIVSAAKFWGRPPFRGGEVNMDASHITIEY
ncbi:MAG: hypothetical protein Q4F10_02395 [Corynebacterium glutamicum]|nr:hypothetical protein [Corynebacterium glutamicum]